MLKFKLEDCNVNFLMDFVRKGRKNARELTGARILLLANEQKRGIDIAKELLKNNFKFFTLGMAL